MNEQDRKAIEAWVEATLTDEYVDDTTPAQAARDAWQAALAHRDAAPEAPKGSQSKSYREWWEGRILVCYENHSSMSLIGDGQEMADRADAQLAAVTQQRDELVEAVAFVEIMATKSNNSGEPGGLSGAVDRLRNLAARIQSTQPHGEYQPGKGGGDA